MHCECATHRKVYTLTLFCSLGSSEHILCVCWEGQA